MHHCKIKNLEKKCVCDACGVTLKPQLRAKAFNGRIQKWQKLIPIEERAQILKL